MGIYSKVKRFGKTVVIFLILLMLVGCPESDNQNHRDTTIYLELIETGVTAVTLQISVEDTCGAWMFGLSRNDSIIMEHSVADKDTTINDTGLEPATEYSYSAYWLSNGKIKDSSNTIIVSTSDTTSHNFIWAADTLGNYGSSIHDVWIVDENNIWVVGNIETDSGSFNAARWDGNEWELSRVWGALSLRGIWYFSEDDIWVTCGFPIHWDGINWTLYHLQNMGLGQYVSVDHIWASSTNNIYFVGYEGSIVHYDGQDFEKMESGTEIDLEDIYGSGDDVWISGCTSSGGNGVLLQNSGQSWEVIIETDMSESGSNPPVDTLYGAIDGIWKSEGSNDLWLANGWGVFNYSIITEKFSWVYPRWWTEPGSYGKLNDIKGTADNNVFACGKLGTILHFNGLSWYWYKDFYADLMWFYEIDATDSIIVMVGKTPDYRGIIIKGSNK